MQRAEHRLAAREGILAAAHRQVADGGWDAAGVAAVAARAGVAAGSLYRHFSSRDDLLAEVLRNAAGGELTLLLRAAGPPERPPAERLDGVVRAFCARAVPGGRLLRAVWLDPVGGAVAAARADARAAHHRLLGGLASDGAARGAWPRPSDPALTGAALFGALLEATLTSRAPGREPAAPRATPGSDPGAAAHATPGSDPAAVTHAPGSDPGAVADALAALCLSALGARTPRARRP